MKYALRRVPVIITDMVPTITTVPWDLQHIKDVAGIVCFLFMPTLSFAFQKIVCHL